MAVVQELVVAMLVVAVEREYMVKEQVEQLQEVIVIHLVREDLVVVMVPILMVVNMVEDLQLLATPQLKIWMLRMVQ